MRVIAVSRASAGRSAASTSSTTALSASCSEATTSVLGATRERAADERGLFGCDLFARDAVRPSGDRGSCEAHEHFAGGQ